MQQVGRAIYRVQTAVTQTGVRVALFGVGGNFNAGVALEIISDYREILNEEARDFARKIIPLMALGAWEEIQRQALDFLREHGVSEAVLEGCRPYIEKEEDKVFAAALEAEVARWNPRIEGKLKELEAEIAEVRTMVLKSLSVQRLSMASSLETLKKLLETSAAIDETEDVAVIQALCGFNPRALTYSLDDLMLNVRVENCLNKKAYKYAWELVELTDADLIAMKNFGGGSLRSLDDSLREVGLSRGMELDPRVKEWARVITTKKTSKTISIAG